MCRLILYLAALVASIIRLSAAEPAESLEYRVKSAFLLNFAKFVDWPQDNAPAASAQLAICVIGDDPFGGALEQMVQGESVGSRRLVARHYASVPQQKCDVAFISKPLSEVAQLLRSLGPGVLTVGEGDRFLREGGMIAFVIDDRRVRFDVNQAAARSGSVRLSSRLLSVARSVEK